MKHYILHESEKPCKKHISDQWILFYEYRQRHQKDLKQKAYRFYCPYCQEHVETNVETYLPSRLKTASRSIRNFYKVVDKYFLENGQYFTTESIETICKNLNNILSIGQKNV